MTPSKQAHQLMQAYFAGKATPEQHEALEAWLREDEEHVRLFVDLALLDGLMVNQQKSDDASALLSVLLESEESAEPIPFPKIVSGPSFGPAKKTDDSVTFQKACAVLAYSLQSGLRRRAGLIAGLAAVILLGLVLVFVLSDGVDPDPIAEQPIETNEPNEPGRVGPEDNPSLTNIVATLTAERDAVWDRRPGAELFAGDRFTLTQGIAEIVTGRGAVVVLEAPSTIELLDNENAIHLHTGKLVGICETESSKGFLVRTSHMDITDIGTRFGVDGTEPMKTQVHVFEGRVLAQRLASDRLPAAEPVEVVAGQALVAEQGTQTLAFIEPAPDQFAAINPRRHRLPGTGAGIERPGQVDPNWQLISVNDERLEIPVHLVRGTPADASVSDTDAARWLRLEDTARYQGGEQALYVIQTRFDVPPGVDPKKAILHITCHTGGQLLRIGINGGGNRDWAKLIEQRQREGKDSFSVRIHEHSTKAQGNVIHFYVRNEPGTELFLRIDWEVEEERLSTRPN